jgi:hypothetical protein
VIACRVVDDSRRIQRGNCIKFASDSHARIFMMKIRITILGDVPNELPQNGQLALA